MDQKIAQLQVLTARQEEGQTVWDTLGSDGKPRVFMADRHQPPWYTTNSEYGRSQRLCHAGTDVINNNNNTRHGVPITSGRALHRNNTSNNGVSATSGSSQLPPLETKYVEQSQIRLEEELHKQEALSNRAAPEYWPIVPTGPPPSLPDPPEARRRLTTGFAGHYMAERNTRFWDNVRSVAGGAGLDAKPKTPQATDSQVLSIYHNDSRPFSSSSSSSSASSSLSHYE